MLCSFHVNLGESTCYSGSKGHDFGYFGGPGPNIGTLDTLHLSTSLSQGRGQLGQGQLGYRRLVIRARFL